MNPPAYRTMFCGSSMAGGGSERQLLNLMNGLDRNRFSARLYLLYAEGALLGDVPADIPVEAFWNRHQIPRLNWIGRTHQQQVRDLRRELIRHQTQLVYDRLFHMTMISGRAVRGLKIARISTIVSPPSFDLARSERRWLWLKKRMLASCYRQADRLLSVSQATAEDASKFYGIALKQFEVIPSPIDLERIDRLAEEPWMDPPFREGAFHIVSIGRLSEEKGHAYLLQSIPGVIARSQRNIQVHLVGDGPLRQQLEQLTTDLGLSARVHLHGHQSNPYKYLVRSDLCCLPSLYEGFPNVMMEALYCRVPLLTTKASESIVALANQCGSGKIVPTASVEGLENAIVDRINCPDTWLATVENARQYVRHNHGLKPWLQQMQTLFTETIQQKMRKSKG